MNTINQYFEFMKEATTATQTARAVKNRLDKSGFIQLDLDKEWTFQPGGKYYTSPFATVVIAFTMGTKPFLTDGFRIITAHTDNPGYRIKSNPEVHNEGMLTLNVEKYGGPIHNTWFDRPLSMAGRIAVKSDNILLPEIIEVDFKRPLLTLPNLAIHMNTKVNKGVEIKVQKDMQPLLTQLLEEEVKDGYLLQMIAEEAGVEASDILDTEMSVYCMEEGFLTGAKNEYISCPRIDDLAMVYAGMEALMETEHEDAICMTAFLDNEEVGSMTKQGADSRLLLNIIERIRFGLERTEREFMRQLSKSFIISADGAHAAHPNYLETSDITNRPVMNKGITIKSSSNRYYASEVETTAAFYQICEKAGVPCQKFLNHSDYPGGRTLGPITSSYLPIPTVDVGVPMLAMHSARELMGKQDFIDSIKVFKTFFSL